MKTLGKFFTDCYNSTYSAFLFGPMWLVVLLHCTIIGVPYAIGCFFDLLILRCARYRSWVISVSPFSFVCTSIIIRKRSNKLPLFPPRLKFFPAAKATAWKYSVPFMIQPFLPRRKMGYFLSFKRKTWGKCRQKIPLVRRSPAVTRQ